MIDELVSQMRMLVDDAREHDDANGYFAAMYLGDTTAVEQGLADGTFTTPDRLSELTTAFARRYLDAVQTHHRGERPTDDRCKGSGPGCDPSTPSRVHRGIKWLFMEPAQTRLGALVARRRNRGGSRSPGSTARASRRRR